MVWWDAFSNASTIVGLEHSFVFSKSKNKTKTAYTNSSLVLSLVTVSSFEPVPEWNIADLNIERLGLLAGVTYIRKQKKLDSFFSVLEYLYTCSRESHTVDCHLFIESKTVYILCSCLQHNLPDYLSTHVFIMIIASLFLELMLLLCFFLIRFISWLTNKSHLCVRCKFCWKIVNKIGVLSYVSYVESASTFAASCQFFFLFSVAFVNIIIPFWYHWVLLQVFNLI